MVVDWHPSGRRVLFGVESFPGSVHCLERFGSSGRGWVDMEKSRAERRVAVLLALGEQSARCPSFFSAPRITVGLIRFCLESRRSFDDG